MDYDDDNLVEVIEDGHIVSVPEFYAKREGLPILRKPKVVRLQKKAINQAPGTPDHIKDHKTRPFIEYLQRPKHWKEKQVTSELLDNFHWLIKIERKKKGLTRKQFAKLLNEPEENLKMIEAGFLPASDFILVNKIQKELGVNLRKDKKDFTRSVNEIIEQESIPEKRVENDTPKKDSDFSGTDIEILEEEI